MFGLGKVTKELKAINQEIRLTDYERARRPLDLEIAELREEIQYLRHKNEVLWNTLKKVADDIEDRNILVVVDSSLGKAMFRSSVNMDKIEQDGLKVVSIPIRESLKEDIQRICEKESYILWERDNN